MDESNKGSVQNPNSEIAKDAAEKSADPQSASSPAVAPKAQHETKEKNPRPRINETAQELKRALDAFNELSKEARKPSPNEQMLSDVKDLLKQLKDKIEEFK